MLRTSEEKKENQWMKVYNEEDEKRVKEFIQENEAIYKNLSRKDYGTIAQCVEYAMKTGNHAAFVHFYYDIAKTGKELFVLKLEQFISRAENKIQWQDILIVNDEYWRAPEFEYIDEKYCKVPEFESKVLNESVAFTKGHMENWRNGKNLPTSKDVIVQIGLWLGCSLEEVDALLVLSGNERLYALSIEDAIAMYYLKYYMQEGISDKSAFEKVCEVKKKINEYVTKNKEKGVQRIVAGKAKIRIKSDYENTMLTEEELLKLEKMGWDKDSSTLTKPDEEALKNMHMGCDKGKKDQKNGITRYKLYRYPYTKLVYSEKLDSWNIEDEYKAICDKYNTYQSDIGFTTYAEKQFVKCRTEEEYFGRIEEFQDEFAMNRRGYLSLMIQALKDVDSYKKNLYYSKYSLDAINIPEKKEVFAESLKFRNSFCENVYIGKKEMGNSQYAKLLHMILTYKNVMSPDEYDINSAEVKSPTERSAAGQYLNGRLQSSQFDNTGNYYEYDLGNKKNVLQYAIATGMEKDHKIYDFLEKAGFWTDEMKNYAKSTEVEIDEKTMFDKLDALILYLLRYRDALIEKWVDAWGTEATREEKSKLRREIIRRFPTLRLLMTINQDIQLATLFEKNNKIVFSKKSVNIVFPVSERKEKEDNWSTMWYSVYEKHSQKLKSNPLPYAKTIL